MAIWISNLSNSHVDFVEAIFFSKKIGCKVEFCFLIQRNEFVGKFITKFRYLTLTEIFFFENSFSKTYRNFVENIESIRNKILFEYNAYFNELWC